MSSPDSSWLSTVSRRKLQTTMHENSSRDNLSLHRWVLLKNFVSNADSAPTSTPSTPPPFAEPPVEEEVFIFPDWDIFVFPDATSIVESRDAADAEAAWLDALLEELDDDPDAVTDLEFATADDDSAAAPFPVSPAPVPLPAPPRPDHLAPSPAAISGPPPLEQTPFVTLAPSSFQASPRAPLSPSPSCGEDCPFCPRTPDLSSAGSDPGADDDERSETESDGPQTPLFLSALNPRGSSPLSHDAVAIVPPDSYFLYPLDPRPISPTEHLAPLYIQDC